MIYISSDNDNDTLPATKTYTPLYWTSPKYTAIRFATLVDTSLLSI
jgi:hypothetical protein